jgi:hypothetical protein
VQFSVQQNVFFESFFASFLVTFLKSFLVAFLKLFLNGKFLVPNPACYVSLFPTRGSTTLDRLL